MITNANLLQKMTYTGTSSDLHTYSDIYLKQALANLGQRFSIKGDGVTTGQFKLYELFNGDAPVPEEGDFEDGGRLYSAYMHVTVTPGEQNPEIALIASYIYDTEQHTYTEVSTTLSTIDYTDLPHDTYNNGETVHSVDGTEVEYYAEGTHIALYNNDNVDKYYIAAKSLSGDKHLLDIFSDIYDDKYNRIDDGLRFYEANGTKYAARITYSYVSDTNVTHYEVKQYEVTANLTLDDLWTNDIHYTVSYNPSKWSNDTILDFFVEGLSYKSKYEVISTLEAPDLQVQPNGDTNPDDALKACVKEWNDTVIYVLPFFKNIYNERVYFSSNNTLRLERSVFTKIISTLYENFIIESDNVNIDSAVFDVYITYDYLFIYTCNSNMRSMLYAADKDITVESIQNPQNEIWKITQAGQDPENKLREQLFIIDSWATQDSTEDIFSIWKWYVIYDEDDRVEDIVVSRDFTLPYINDDGYWNINNVDTNIYARGKNGGQPSVIISYSDTSVGKHEILSTLNKDELTTAIDWDIVEFRVRPLDTSISNTYHIMRTYMPVDISTAYLSENLVTFLENAIILDVSSVHSEDTSKTDAGTYLADNDQLGSDGIVTTFWALTQNNDKSFSFTYVKQPDSNWAVDFNYLTSAEAIIKHYLSVGIEPDRYRHSWLVFDGINPSLKNQPSVFDRPYVYPVLMNRDISAFSDIFDIEEQADDKKYDNQLNFTLSFSDDVEIKNSYIVSVPSENTRRFFRFDVDSNSSYPYKYKVPVVQTLKSINPNEAANEWYPDGRNEQTEGWTDSVLPILDLKEVFIRNMNTLNRYNMLHTDANGIMYYSYIGTTYEDANKSILHIGTGTTDINLGLKTLTTKEERSHFEKQHELDIDFDRTLFNGDAFVKGISWNVYEKNGYKEYSAIFHLPLIGEIKYNNLQNEASQPVENQSLYIRNNETVFEGVNNIGGGVKVPAHHIYFDYLNVNKLLSDILKLPVSNITNVYGDNTQLTYVTSSSSTTYFLRLSSYLDNNIVVPINPTFSIYAGNPIALSYSNYSRSGVNIREINTTLSSAASIYDGGEL